MSIFIYIRGHMIKAFIFDLDGTLIQTEVLKASSYAKAIQSLTRDDVQEQQVMEVFGNYVGLSRTEVVKGLYEVFSEELEANLNMTDSVSIQETLIEKRLFVYRKLLEDSELLSHHFCPFSLGLLQKVHSDGFQVVLATMSHATEANRVIDIMEIRDRLNLILTRDVVKEGKPDPEIYLMAADKLGLESRECIVIEDSVNGIRAGLRAGMHVFAVTNDVTRKSVHDCDLLEDQFIVDDLGELVGRVYRFMKALQN